MADRVREACEHGRYESCDELITNGVPISPDGVKHPVFSWKPCPSGWEVTIDYKAANEELNYQLARGKTYSAFAIIAAALPDLEV